MKANEDAAELGLVDEEPRLEVNGLMGNPDSDWKLTSRDETLVFVY